nr:protein yippee-like At5g53940 [Ipomoea batatas]
MELVRNFTFLSKRVSVSSQAKSFSFLTIKSWRYNTFPVEFRRGKKSQETLEAAAEENGKRMFMLLDPITNFPISRSLYPLRQNSGQSSVEREAIMCEKQCRVEAKLSREVRRSNKITFVRKSWTQWQGEFNQHFISRMGRIFVVDLEGRTYNCKFCKTQLALADDLVSRVYKNWFLEARIAKLDVCLAQAFHCRRGKAYLFNNVVNNMVGPLEERMMLSGMHTVADIFCCCCGQIIGWKYEAAHEKSQKYKEGKFVLESCGKWFDMIDDMLNRGRIIDGGDSEFYIGNHPILSDAEDA